MRNAQYLRFKQGDEATLAERRVLERAVVRKVARRLDREEQERVLTYGADPRIEAALMQLDRYGLAEYLAAGPALLGGRCSLTSCSCSAR
jgi:eukaryotic-like serine/threonine-protein kinase